MKTDGLQRQIYASIRTERDGEKHSRVCNTEVSLKVLWGLMERNSVEKMEEKAVKRGKIPGGFALYSRNCIQIFIQVLLESQSHHLAPILVTL